jgi:aspartate racemase
MKRIGLLGGMSWESSIEYERLINEGVRARLGGTHSADLVVRSYDFAVVESLQQQGRWGDLGDLLAADAVMLQDAGAELVLLCSNTMHLVAPAIEAALDVELVHLVDVAAQAVVAAGMSDVGLLGTRYTMEGDFYRERLARHGLNVSVPSAEGRAELDRIIFGELVQGVIDPGSRQRVTEMVDELVASGATGVISGCTEIELLVGAGDVPVAWFPTTQLHAAAAVALALD